MIFKITSIPLLILYVCHLCEGCGVTRSVKTSEIIHLSTGSAVLCWNMLKHDPTLDLENGTSIVSTAIYGRIWFQTSVVVTTDLMSVYGRQIFSQGLSVNIPGQDLSIFSNTIKVKTALVLCKFYEVIETTGSLQMSIGQKSLKITMYLNSLCDRQFSNMLNSDPFWGISLVSELLRVLVECPRVCIIRFCLGLSRSSDLGNATFGSLGMKIWIKNGRSVNFQRVH